MDPLAGSPWSLPATVDGFVRSPPNDVLLNAAAQALSVAGERRLLDIGCGAGRNALPLARMGWRVVGTDLSWPMLAAARERAINEDDGNRLRLVLAPMEHLPISTCSIDFIVAHGIWNLATSVAMFRRAVAEAARVARPGAALFVFTFSRHTLPPEAEPVPGEPFVFTQFSGRPQCFLTEEELINELASAGFSCEPGVPIREYNRRQPGALVQGTGPVIYEGLFRRNPDA
jgi:SAM-dependent methyltransferase